ncbi:MAG: histidine kinase [Bacteroidota bacterium]
MTLYAFQAITAEVFRTELFDIHQVIYGPFVRLLVGWFLALFFVIPLYNIIKRQNTFVKITGFSFAAIFFGSLYSAISNFIFYLISISTRLNLIENFFQSFLEEILATYHHSIMYCLLFITVLISIDYMRARLEAVENERKLQEILSKTKLNVLKNQLQPHFLFNALNSISSMIDDERVVAQDMIADVSALLRRSLRTNYLREITLDQELELLELYWKIEKRRFEHQLIIETQVSEEARKCYILPFILQPIVENAIKHGFTKNLHLITLRILGNVSNNQLHIAISNNGKPLTKFCEGIGLENIKKRLNNTYRDGYTFSLEQQNEMVVATIRIIQ